MTTHRLVGHRGHPARFPENSIAGLQSAAEAGARFVEIDLQCSADDTLWLFHDPGTLRLTGTPGSIEETSEVLGVGHATVERDWRAAQAWLLARLGDGDASG